MTMTIINTPHCSYHHYHSDYNFSLRPLLLPRQVSWRSCYTSCWAYLNSSDIYSLPFCGDCYKHRHALQLFVIHANICLLAISEFCFKSGSISIGNDCPRPSYNSRVNSDLVLLAVPHMHGANIAKMHANETFVHLHHLGCGAASSML